MEQNCCMTCKHFYYIGDGDAKCLLLEKKNKIEDFFEMKDNCPLMEDI